MESDDYEEISAPYDYMSNTNYELRLAGIEAVSGNGSVDVVFLGDSLVELWQTEMSFPSISSMNQGISGDVVEGVLNRLHLVEAFDPQLVVLEIGTNDAEKGVDLDVSSEQVEAIIKKLTEESGRRVLLLSIPPRPADDSEFTKSVKSLNLQYKEIADKCPGCSFIDLDTVLGDEQGVRQEELFQDSEHLSAEGYRSLSSEIESELVSILQ